MTTMAVDPYPSTAPWWRHPAIPCPTLGTQWFMVTARGNPPPRSSDGRPSTYARAACRSCPVQAPCLAAAIREGDAFSIRGGLTPKERAVYLRGKAG